jgi:hypothetical protein
MMPVDPLLHVYAPSPRLCAYLSEVFARRGSAIPQRDIGWLAMWKAFHAGQRPWQIAALEQLTTEELEEMRP